MFSLWIICISLETLLIFILNSVLKKIVERQNIVGKRINNGNYETWVATGLEGGAC